MYLHTYKVLQSTDRFCKKDFSQLDTNNNMNKFHSPVSHQKFETTLKYQSFCAIVSWYFSISIFEKCVCYLTENFTKFLKHLVYMNQWLRFKHILPQNLLWEEFKLNTTVENYVTLCCSKPALIAPTIRAIPATLENRNRTQGTKGYFSIIFSRCQLKVSVAGRIWSLIPSRYRTLLLPLTIAKSIKFQKNFPILRFVFQIIGWHFVNTVEILRWLSIGINSGQRANLYREDTE